MVVYRGVQNADGWWIKSTENGQPYPLDSRLYPVLRNAGVETLHGVLQYSEKRFGSRPCMAKRKLLSRKRVEENGKMMEKLHLGEYQWISYEEASTSATLVGRNIRAMGVSPGTRVAIFAETRPEWFMAAMGCLQHHIVVCTLYTTLNNSGIVHAINETEVSFVFTSYDLLDRLIDLLPQCIHVTTVIVMEDQIEGYLPESLCVPSNVSVIPFNCMLNKDCPAFEQEYVTKDDLAIIMYTSGSTGTPKGVELSHDNILTSSKAYSVQMNVGEQDRFLAFLPLAHIMEMATEVALVALGVKIMYSSPHTLTSSSSKIMPGTTGDAVMAQPTVMNAVPLILDRIIKGVTQAVESQGWLKAYIFMGLVQNKYWLEYIPLTSYVLDYFIFNRVKEELGGQLKRLVVGGAPLSPDTHYKMMAIFGCSIQVGYGSTETASCISGMNEGDYRTGHAGGPNLGVLFCLANWEEGDYRVTDKPYPRGEIVVGGPVVAKGYFRNKQENEESFFVKNGTHCFLTGDIGEIDESGSLRIIDRKKDLIKLKHGEYISLGNIESKLKTIQCIDNICIFADSTKEKVVAIVVPLLDRLQAIASSMSITYNFESPEELCTNKQIEEFVLKEIYSHGRKSALTHWEIPAAIRLTAEIWTPETGFVTAALKLRRKQLAQHYQSQIQEMYAYID